MHTTSIFSLISRTSFSTLSSFKSTNFFLPFFPHFSSQQTKLNNSNRRFHYNIISTIGHFSSSYSSQKMENSSNKDIERKQEDESIAAGLSFLHSHPHGSGIPRGIYRHYKGKYYSVIGTSINTETLEECVVYTSLYESEGNKENKLWSRPLNMFISDIEIGGKIMKRFTLVRTPEEADKLSKSSS